MHSLRWVGTVSLNTLPSVAMTAAGSVPEAVGQVGVVSMTDQQGVVGGHRTWGRRYARTCPNKNCEISLRKRIEMFARSGDAFLLRELRRGFLV